MKIMEQTSHWAQPLGTIMLKVKKSVRNLIMKFRAFFLSTSRKKKLAIQEDLSAKESIDLLKISQVFMGMSTLK